MFRLGATCPPRASSYTAVQTVHPGRADRRTGVLGLANLFSGGALLQLSIFALGIMPYITASIIVQLLTVVIPRFEALKKEGQPGQTKLTQYTRYLTIGLAVLQSATLDHLRAEPAEPVRHHRARASCPTTPSPTIVIMVLTMTAGTGLVMWLGELVTDKGIGNGMSLLIFTSIAAAFPGSLWAIQQQEGRWDIFIGVILLGFLVIALVVFVEQSQRRIPVQYAKRHGRPPACTAAPPPTSRSRSTWPASSRSSSPRRCWRCPTLVAQFNRAPTGDQPGWVTWIDAHLVTRRPPALHGHLHRR